MEFLSRFAADAPGSERFFQAGAAADKRLFDLPAFVLDRLDRAGVGQSEWIGLDTQSLRAINALRDIRQRIADMPVNKSG